MFYGFSVGLEGVVVCRPFCCPDQRFKKSYKSIRLRKLFGSFVREEEEWIGAVRHGELWSVILGVGSVFHTVVDITIRGINGSVPYPGMNGNIPYPFSQTVPSRRVAKLFSRIRRIFCYQGFVEK